MAKMSKIKVLIADDDGQLSRRLAAFISDHGFDCRLANSGSEARFQILDWKPRIVLADLMLPEVNAMGLLDFIKEQPSLKREAIQVLIMSGHNNEFNVKQALAKGAKDYLVKPFRYEDILRRLVFHCRSYRHLSDLNTKEFTQTDEGSLMLHLTDLVLRQANSGESLPNILYNLTRMVSMKVDGVRCSVIEVLDQQNGIVVVSNDDRGASGIRLDLNKYPEVLNVVNTGVMIAIENIENSPELKLIKKLLKDIMFNSMIVCPVSRFHRPFGVLSLRMPAHKTAITDNEMRFVEIVSHVVSLVLSNQNQSTNGEPWRHGDNPGALLPFAGKASKNK